LTQLTENSPVLTEAPARAGEDAATLYESYAHRIREYCYGQLRNRQEAEDAVQSTFLYALTLLRRGETPRRPLPWLYTIAHNVCRTRRRAMKRRSNVESTVDLDVVQETVGRDDPSREDVDLLAKSLAGLPASQRTALLLREWQGLSYEEIGAALGLTESAVEAVLFRARRNLAQKLQYVTDRAATIAGGVLLLPSLRRLSPFGTAARTAATAVVLGTAATTLLPIADSPRPGRAAEHAISRHSAPAGELPRVRMQTSAVRPPLDRIVARATPVDTPTLAARTAAPPPSSVAEPVPTQVGTADTTPAPPQPPSPAASTPVQTVVGAANTTLGAQSDVGSTVQTVAAAAQGTVSSATGTLADAASTVTTAVGPVSPPQPAVLPPTGSPPKDIPLQGSP
jgi:RNA polymerase sigma factor (sigma-70 family)